MWCVNLPVGIWNGEGIGGGCVVGWLPIVCQHSQIFSYHELDEMITGLWRCGTVVSRFYHIEYYVLSYIYLRWSALPLIRRLEYLSKKTSEMCIINQSISFYMSDRSASRLKYDIGIDFIYTSLRIFRRRHQGGQRKWGKRYIRIFYEYLSFWHDSFSHVLIFTRKKLIWPIFFI